MALIFDRPIDPRAADHRMGNPEKFQFVCGACGSLTIKVSLPDRAPETTVIECGRCNAPRGTLAALRDLARSGRSDLFEF